MFILLTQFQQFLEHPQPWFLQLSCIHLLPSTFQKMHHQFLLWSIFRGITMIGFYKSLHFIISTLSSFILSHCISFTLSLTHPALPSPTWGTHPTQNSHRSGLGHHRITITSEASKAVFMLLACLGQTSEDGIAATGSSFVCSAVHQFCRLLGKWRQS